MAFTCKLIECYPGFGPELTTDGNMEDDPTTNWPAAGGGAVAADTTTVRNGCQSLEVTDGGAGGGYASQTIIVEAGHKYKIDVWGYSTAAGDTWRVRIYVGANVVWTSATHDVTAPVAWEKETKFYRVPTGVTAIILRLEVVGVAKVVYFDDVTVKREAPVPMSHIDLFYHADAGWAMLEKGLEPNDPERRELWGGYLEDQLVRQEDGKRIIPLKLQGKWTSPDTLIDAVNALEEMLRHAARFRKDGWGGECFLEFQLHAATHPIWYPVCSGAINKNDLMNACGLMMEDGHRVAKALVEVGVTIVCESYWESPYTYDLANLLDNPGFEEWNAGICNSQPDGWTDYESLTAGTGVNNQETDNVAEGGKALRIEVVGIDAGDYKGVEQDLGAAAGSARVSDDVQYTLLAWLQNTNVITNGQVGVHVIGSVSGLLGIAFDTAAVHADYTLFSCQFTPTGGDAAGNVWIRARITGIIDGCSGIAHIDKMLVMESSNVPTGWMSSSYLMNHYDRTANHINFLSVCDVPGEVEAEARYCLDIDQNEWGVRVAKRTRNAPADFIWQLTPCAAYTTAEGGVGGACTPGLTDAACIDSDKLIDATAPSGSRINVTFAGNQAMNLRCHWDIVIDPTSYYGKFVLLLIAKMEGATDTATVRLLATDETNTLGYIVEKDIDYTEWNLYDGWEVLAYRIGTADNNLMGTGNSFRIGVFAETDGTPTDDLHIAGGLLVAIDEAYLVGGAPTTLASTIDLILKELDGDKGFFAYSSVTDRYFPNFGCVGQMPLLTPEIENWLYFVVTDVGAVDAFEAYTLSDTFRVSLSYRPRGIFLRGSNP